MRGEGCMQSELAQLAVMRVPADPCGRAAVQCLLATPASAMNECAQAKREEHVMEWGHAPVPQLPTDCSISGMDAVRTIVLANSLA